MWEYFKFKTKKRKEREREREREINSERKSITHIIIHVLNMLQNFIRAIL